ncbi:FAD-binding oxidoreductase [Desulfopila aestuarii]|uniref:D-lactate dehydrogenase (cytochrome) n=1 Tax=Desulfopila aestuarii DSM 18488 TaxID=1121416 RepID=A0A1M7XY75_9BACT|nr:FAD-binding oxidoreductase [Desulfopila aestuarii]SHO43906.1 FAD/FMN-containing dehydrogenase [Desulfopila aestuarii DSM 18488]
MFQKDTLVKIVGEKNVTDESSTLDTYSKDLSFVNTLRPDFVIKPKNANEIAQLVKLANETKTPLVPVSSGAQHFRGDTVPGSGGAVVLDLSGMKKIMRTDRYHRVAMCEPGVTFEELIPAVEKEGIRLNLPLLPRKSKSVVGSLLEREPVTMPTYQWDISDPLACLGLIVGTGEEFRTGQAAGPGTIEEQWEAGAVQKAPYGPGSTCWHRLFQGAQGTMGIATWASIRCEILPTLEEPFLVGSPYVERLFELSHWLIRLRLVNECFILNNTNLAAIMAKNWPCDYQAIKHALPPWILFYNLAGYEYYPEERVSYRKKNIQSLTQKIAVESTKALAGISAGELLQKVHRPSEEPYWKLRYKGASHDIFFLSIADKLPGLLDAMNIEANKASYPASDIGVYIQPGVQGSSYHCEFNIFYDPQSPSEINQVSQLSTAATLSLMDKGAFFSRPYGKSTDAIMNRDAATVTALTKVKNIFDPNNILNPGKLCF